MSGLVITTEVCIADEFLTVKAARSSGPGGQNVNKTATKAELHFNVADCPTLTQEVKSRLSDIARNRLDAAGNILITSQKTRSLLANAADAREKLRSMILRAMFPPKPRIATKVSAGAKRARVENKRKHGEAKRRRQEWNLTERCL